MGKRRNGKGETYAGVGGNSNTNSSNSYGGSLSKNYKLSVFDFADDQLRVETESRKTLAKFGTKSPSKKLAYHRQPIDKYVFLETFAQGTMSQQKDFGNDVSDVDAFDCVLQNRTCGNDVPISPGSLDCESLSISGAKSSIPVTRKSGGYTTGKKRNKVLYADSDEGERTQLRSSSCFDLAENEGSLEEQTSEYCAENNDCETVVVVAPYYVKYGGMYYKSCTLTFSKRCIRLKGSPLCEKKRPYYLEWLTSDILKIEYQQYESVKADIVNLHLKSKDRNVGEMNSSSGSAELEFVVLDDLQWPEKQEEIKSLDLKYKAVWKTIVSGCCFNESFDNIIYPDGDPDAVFLSRSDIELLQPRTFINDTIIDFYIKYLVNERKPGEQHRFHFFNTFFFRKLVDMSRDLSRDGEERDAFRSVRKWTRNVNIFEKDYIFIPVNFSLHWSLIVICHPGEVASLREEGMDASPKVPCILHMDSIIGSHRGFEDLIRRYLSEEWKERGNKQEEDIATTFLNLDFIVLQLPQQENLFDCGLFLLHYAELFLEQASNFSATKSFDFLNKDWFHPAEVSLKKRDHIRKLIHKIVEANALKDLPAAHNNYHQSGINEGNNGAKFVQQIGDKESCHGIKFNSCDDFKNEGQQSFIAMPEHRNIDKLVLDEYFQPCSLLMPINQFNNMSLPMEEALEKQGTFPPGEKASGYEVDDKPMPPRYNHCGLKRAEMKGSQATCCESPIIIDEEYCVSTERQKDRCEKSSMSSEDLAACVVEDSEEESGTQSIRKSGDPSF